MVSEGIPAAILVVLVAGTTAGVVGTTSIVDLDGDGVPAVTELDEGIDPLADDTDQDGLDDGRERELGTDPNDADADADGLDDREELATYETDPTDADTDGDGLNDGEELDLETDPTNEDTDGDDLTDDEEIDRGTDPRNEDTDGDRLADGVEVHERGTDPAAADTDGDGLADGEELRYDADPTDADTDGDGLDDAEEVRDHDTDPAAVDTDGEELDDYAEVHEHGTDPTGADSDDDYLDDREELTEYGTEPTNSDTDGDGFEDGLEVDPESPIADADPLRKDIFVEIDYMRGQEPTDQLDRVVDAYADAPIENPDGSTGIALHLVVDGEIPARSETTVENRNRLMYEHMDHDGHGYHYALAVVDPVIDGESMAGFSALRYSNGAFVFKASGGEGELSTFMHELGHSVGISSDDYEGVDSDSVKYDEYPSVMNYNHHSGKHPLEYSDGEPFDDWAHIDDTLYTPRTDSLEGIWSESR